VRHYLDLLEDTFMVRQLRPYAPKVGKRLVKSPKVYLRDSGMLHALLRAGSLEELLGHPAVGASWEGWVIEQILALAPSSWSPCFYRTSAGAEIDLVLSRGAGRAVLAIEVKYSARPTVSRGFYQALNDLEGARGIVVCPCRERYPMAHNVTALPVAELPACLTEES
jgi:predicted AAA+ superfamily ATPase